MKYFQLGGRLRLILLGMVVFGTIILSPTSALAADGKIKVTLSPDNATAVVTATREANNNPYPLTYTLKRVSNYFISDPIGHDNPLGKCSAINRFNVSVKSSSGTALAQKSGVCVYDDRTIDVAITIPKASTAGTLSGSIKVTDPNAPADAPASDKNRPALAGTVITLTNTKDSNKKYTYTLPAGVTGGNYSIPGITAGTYNASIKGTYNSASASSNSAFTDTDTVTIKAGANTKNFVGSGTIVDSVDPADANGDGIPDDQEVDSCDTNILNWLVCPLVDLTFKTINRLDSLINQILTIDTDQIYSTNPASSASADDKKSSTAYYTAWSNFRNIAIGLLVICTLVIVIASAFGLEFLDAYTIRKAMPRAFLAVILIVLSWSISNFLITLSNDVGNGIRALIYAPFSGFEPISMDLGDQYLLGAVMAASAVFYGLAILTFGVTALLGIGIALMTLILREMIVIFLIIIAPVAIILMILPNTQKYWQLWQNTFTAMLIAFPIIAGFIAIGRVFSLVAFQDGTAGTIGTMIAFVAYFAPYFMIPLAFKMAGGLMGTLAGLSNDKSRGAFDRLSKRRQAAGASNMNKMKSGNRFEEHGGKFNPLGASARAFNRTTVGAGTGTKGGFGFGKRGTEAIDARRRMAMGDLMKTPQWQTLQENDDGLMAATYGSAAQAQTALTARYMAAGATREAAAERAKTAVNAANTSIGFGRPQAITAAQQLATTGTGYDNMDDQVETIARASGGNKSTAASIAGYNNFVSKQKGRHDLAPGAGNLIGGVHQYMDESSTGLAHVNQSLKVPATSDRPNIENAWNSGSLYQVSNGKSTATKNFVKHFGNMARSTTSSTKPEDIKRVAQDRERAAIAFMEMQNSLPSASGENQKIMIQAMEDAGIDYKGASEKTAPSLDDQIAKMTNGTMNATEIRSRARVYDQQAALTQQNNS